MDPEEIAKILQDRIDEEEAATGKRSPLRDQPAPTISAPNVLDEVPGFTKEGDPDAPYYVPTPETKKSFVPMADDQQAPSSRDDSPALGPTVPDPEAELRALIPDAFERAAQSQRRFATSGGREEGGASKFLEKALPGALKAADDFAKSVTEQSTNATFGDTYNPKPVLDAAQLAIPGKGALLLAGGLMAAEQGAKNERPLSGTPEELAKLLVPGAEAKTDQEKLIEAARKRMSPEQQGTAPPDAAEQLRRLGQDRLPGGDAEVQIGEPQVNTPIPKLPTKPKQRSKETPEAFAERMNAYEAQKAAFYKTYTPTATRIFQTVGGPKVVNTNDIENLATGAFLISAGMILAPRVFRAFKGTVTAPPRSLKDALTLQPGVFAEQKGQGFNLFGPRPVREAMPGTTAYSTPFDLARSADDINRVALGIGAKNGIIPAVQEKLENTFGIYSRSNARHLTQSAVETGRMETPAFRFTAPVSVGEMQRTFTPEMRQYITMLDTFESLVERSRLPQYTQGPRNPTPGLPMIAGETVQTLGPAIRALELAHPEVIPAARSWEQWNRAVRKFQSTGEYATIPKNSPNPNPATPNRSVAYLNANRRFEVPWLGRKQDRGLAMDERIRAQDPIQMQSRYSKVDLNERLNNEAIGQFVDAMRQARPNSFVRVGRNEREAAEILADNPRYLKNTVTFYRRGLKETYTTEPTMADALKMDPYVVTNGAGQLIYGAKRALEFGATGLGAPFFATTSALRSWQIGKYTADAGYRSPTLMGTIAAVPQQLYPMLARGIARSMEAGSGGLLSRFAGQGWADSLAQTMTGHYNASLYAQLQRVGSARGSILEHERISTGLDQFRQVLRDYTGPAKPWLNAYANTLEAIHNGPAFDYVRRNLSVAPLSQVAARARALTGDPRTAGQYYFEPVGGGKAQPIRYERSSVSHTIGDIAARTMMVPTEIIGRDAIPWFNATQQGIKRIGIAYLNDPVKFTRNMWLYAGMPAAAGYAYAYALGDDPNGVSYVDYMMNRRSAYNRQMNWYIPIPGLPAERGVELPFFHEMAPAKRLTEVGMHHMFAVNPPNVSAMGLPESSNQNPLYSQEVRRSLQEDMWTAAHNFMDTAIIPPLPPVVGAPMAAMGINPPMGVFGGEPYAIKTDPFDQLGGMPANIEAFSRAIGGGAATTIGAGYAAFTQTPDGFAKALMNAGSEVGKSIISRTPIVRDITGILPPMSGNTDVRKELFDKQKEIDQLLKFYQKWDKNAGNINVDPASKGGGNVADMFNGPASAAGNPGLKQPPPNNPLYIKFMADVYNRFKHESPNYVKGEDQGGLGFRSLWRRYGDASEALKMLRPINDGNNVTWQSQLNNNPDVVKELIAAKVDTKNLREVKNYYVMKQQDAARVIVNVIRAVEEDFSKAAGKPITIKDLKPYVNKSLQESAPDAGFAFPDVVDEVARNWNQGAPAP